MPRRKDLKKVVILGSGPIVIGQACEFDYSGTQACKALVAEGLEVILINSNPATIMTDPDVATRVYIEPLKVSFVEKILELEKPDGIIPTLGGQTALNLALELEEKKVLERLNIKMLGANPRVIRSAEDRELFQKILDSVGAHYPKSELVRSFDQGVKVAQNLGLPIVLRPNYTLGGGGGGIAFSREEFEEKLVRALHESPTSEVLLEKSILGWKEFELEVMRDKANTFVVVCTIENLDPCGVHTGDSITVAPQQTLSDREYQAMRDEARKIMDAVGLETGGANIQFAVNPKTGDRVVIEMNPRVSRSSALASKATGFPIAKTAALLAIGYELEEIRNDITGGKTPMCYEPALDYVVTKIPRFAFEKFPGSKDLLTTQMKSVGEVMAIGRTFKESLQKALHAMEGDGLGVSSPVAFAEDKLATPNSQRIYHVFEAFRRGQSAEEINQITQIDPWFLDQIQELINAESHIQEVTELNSEIMSYAKRLGFSDKAIAKIRNETEENIRKMRWSMNIRPAFLQVDTCAAEFKSETPYLYSTYWSKPQAKSSLSKNDVILVLGSGPNRIGQGIEFDYGCVRGVKRLRQVGAHVVMVNSNPETVSTDYDTSNELYFEPLTQESVIEVLSYVKPKGFVSQLGGQTPINLCRSLVEGGFTMLGSSLEAIDLAEDRGRFGDLCRELDVRMPAAGMARSLEEAKQVAARIDYPLMCRPSYVLGGRRMEVVESEEELESYFGRHAAFVNPQSPFLIDQFLGGALEVDVDLVRGQDWVVIGGVVEHIEAAGVHSGDSMGVVPPQRLKDETCRRIEEVSLRIAESLNVIGYLNLQIAIKNDQIFVLEANPRSSRTVPFLAKATRIPLVDLGVMAMLGAKKADIKPEKFNWRDIDLVSVKGVVFPFKKFPDSDSILGPEMKSTGESMGRSTDYGEALLKAMIQSLGAMPSSGEVFLSLRDKDKEPLLPAVREILSMGYSLSATKGTADFFEKHQVPCLTVNKVHEGRPNCVDRIRSGQVAFVINTTGGRRSIEASFSIRRSCTDYFVPCITESDAAEAFVLALKKLKSSSLTVAHIPKQIELALS